MWKTYGQGNIRVFFSSCWTGRNLYFHRKGSRRLAVVTGSIVTEEPVHVKVADETRDRKESKKAKKSKKEEETETEPKQKKIKKEK
jgi:hypothetical protein